MFRFLVIIILIFLGVVYFGNYLDLKKQLITKQEYDRRVRLFVLLVFLLIAIAVWLKKR